MYWFFKNRTLKANKLLAGPTESVYKATTGTYNSQYRDIGKYYLDASKKRIPMMIAEFSVENQSTYDKYIAFRIMSYDSASYKRQKNNKIKKVAPVISIVLNFSDTKYSDTMGLKEFMRTSLVTDSLADYDECGDYRVRCYNVAYLDDDIIESFTSDFKSVAYFFKNKRVFGENFAPNNDEIKHVEAFMDLLSVFTNDQSYKKSIVELTEKQKKGKVITMCEVREGWVRQGINNLFIIVKEIQNGVTDEQIAKNGYSEEIIKQAHDMIALVEEPVRYVPGNQSSDKSGYTKTDWCWAK